MSGPTENPTDRPGAWHRRLLRAVALAAIALAGTGVAVAAADSTGTSTAATPSSVTDPTGATTTSRVTDATGPATASSVADPTSGTTTDATTTGEAPATTTAPAGFAASLITIYSDEYAAATALDSASSALSGKQLPAPSTFSQNVDDLTPDELSQLYAASQQQPQWSQLGGALSTLDAQARSFTASAGASGSSERAAAAGAETGTTDTSTDSFPPAAPTTTIATPPATFSPTQSVGPTQTVTCPAGAPGGPSIAPGDDAVYAAQLTVDVANTVAADVSPTITIDLVSYPNPAKYIAEAIAFAGQVTLDTLNYYQQVASDCDTGNEDAFLANIDNTTQQLYALESDTIQPTVDAIETGLETLHEQVKVVQESVDEQLTIDIEQALSVGTTSGASSPVNIEFLLPAADGGNLNSTPVGVQEVVTSAVSQAQSAGLVVNAMVTRELAAANDALSAGQYRTAYTDYQAAYQGLG